MKPEFFEDYHVGAIHEFGSARVDEAELIDFASRYDPQYLHIDREAAARGPFGGLIASGWHTASITMRLLVEHFIPAASSLGSPGIDELRWLLPVRPGDELRVRVTVLEARRSRTKPDRGLLKSLMEVFNQRNELVMSMRALNFVRLRHPAG
ncbi:MAG TPA: MaoC family dehydratase [Candidatus Binataceae bacterium]|nr:MaoC family dehydratase [Candidatus Binataceae bacterium]